jgi:hypothetical protein
MSIGKSFKVPLLFLSICFGALSAYADPVVAPSPRPSLVPPAPMITPPIEATPTPAPVAPSAVGPTANGSLYYCPSAYAYYPAISSCPESWVAIPVQAPPQTWYPHRIVEETTSEEAVIARPNSVNLQLLGAALNYSVNYDRAISDQVTLGVGYSYWAAENWFHTYHSDIMVVPAYANIYFSQAPERGFISGGLDWIHVTSPGHSSDTFSHDGVAGVIGAGYELRSNGGFLLRIAADLIIGQSVLFNPSFTLGFCF